MKYSDDLNQPELSWAIFELCLMNGRCSSTFGALLFRSTCRSTVESASYSGLSLHLLKEHDMTQNLRLVLPSFGPGGSSRQKLSMACVEQSRITTSVPETRYASIASLNNSIFYWRL